MAQQDTGGDLEVTWAHPIGTRDGTLTTDAKMVNCFVEREEGETSAIVKRPGTSYQSTVTGTAQGFFTYNKGAYFIVNDAAWLLTPPSQVFIANIPSVLTPGQFYTSIDSSFATNNVIIQNQAGELWQFNGTGFTKVTDTNYTGNNPQFGIAYLDGVYYAINTIGRVIGSAINDPTTWPALDFVQADIEYGRGVTISRHLNYILAFYEQGMQVYWDANAAPNGSGIALNPVLSASFRTGCFNAGALSEINDVTYFMATSPLYGRSVQMLNGLQMQKISDTYIEKILNNPLLTPTATNIWSFGIQISGHSFFVLNLSPINITLAYDITSGVWNVWTSVVGGVEGHFIGRGYVAVEGTNGAIGDYIQDTTTGKVMLVSPSLYTDATGNINVTCVTPKYNWGNHNYKRFALMQQMADTIPDSINISFSDDDYQTFSTPRQLSLQGPRKEIRNCGSSRSRIWMMTYSGNFPLRLNSLSVPTVQLTR